MTSQEPTNIELGIFSSSAAIPLKITGIQSSVTLGTEQVRIIKSTSVYVNTTEYWNNQIGYIPKVGDIIVYSDYSFVLENDVRRAVPGVKIGDGLAYLSDLPFITEATSQKLLEHIENRLAHVSAEDREFWDNKLNYTVCGEELLFNRE